MKNRTYNILTIVAVCIALAGLTVAFAALSSTLTISGTATIKQSSWSVDFQTPTGLALSGSAAWVDSPSGGLVEGTPTVVGTTTSFQVELNTPGDYAEFTVPVKNNGTINAELTNFTQSVTGTDSDLLILSVQENGTPVTNGSITLAAGQTKNVVVRLTYDPNATAEDLPVADRTISVQLTMVFEQD